jgi:hypothetical protein
MVCVGTMYSHRLHFALESPAQREENDSRRSEVHRPTHKRRTVVLSHMLMRKGREIVAILKNHTERAAEPPKVCALG